ncbi:MAG: hypothetical protein JRJ15_02840 [Deltaproteobacteria bacterium]|nr:hypothetical protein [Deltaproteobacteria bacterium]
MTIQYSVELTRKIEEMFHQAALHRPMRVDCYDVGAELVYDVTEVAGQSEGRVRLIVEKFVGGGFAGQVYQVKVLDMDPEATSIGGLEVGGIYAIKILIPPSNFSRMFRNALYWIGFQGPFQLQVNPAAARAGAIWQKFIRRGAKIHFGNESVVADIHATFIDSRLGSCGELSEWVEGRTWQLEADERLDLLKLWKKGKKIDQKNLGSPEYRAKREFMARFVGLLHNMGGQEFARQYEWSTCKSQPNCLKRTNSEGSPSEGLVAIDFRAGLALLPFLPMSPGDFKLIARGLMRGSLIQFDRGDIGRLEQFVEMHRDEFADMRQLLEELKETERVYRNSIPDITHNHLRLFYSPQLWSTMLDSAVTGWRTRNLLDEQSEIKLRGNRVLTLLFFIIGIIPLIGGVIRKFWCRADWRDHYREMLTSSDYLCRAFRGRIAEKVIGWSRAGRVVGASVLKVARQPVRFFCHLPLSVLPGGLHRFLTDWQFAREILFYLAVRPIRLYFDAELREQWLREMVTEGKKKHLLNDEDAEVILSHVKDFFIQKYLKSLAVHVCTLPVTQVVSVIVALVYVAMHPELSWNEAAVRVGAILVAFQITPVSPGSLVRGFYVLYLVLKERNFRDYNIAVFLGFFKYIGYLAFPIQMAHRYPALARFMAGHWATEAVHAVPVFGERGALLEHGVFCLFYNRPLTIRRRMRIRSEVRMTIKPRYWHIALYTILGAALLGLTDFAYLRNLGGLPGLKDIWPLAVLVPMICGAGVTLGAGGAVMWKRIIGAVICGLAVGILYTVVSATLGYGGPITAGEIATGCAWRAFFFTILSAAGVFLTELNLPEPGT